MSPVRTLPITTTSGRLAICICRLELMKSRKTLFFSTIRWVTVTGIRHSRGRKPSTSTTPFRAKCSLSANGTPISIVNSDAIRCTPWQPQNAPSAAVVRPAVSGGTVRGVERTWAGWASSTTRSVGLSSASKSFDIGHLVLRNLCPLPFSLALKNVRLKFLNTE